VHRVNNISRLRLFVAFGKARSRVIIEAGMRFSNTRPERAESDAAPGPYGMFSTIFRK
jgi:hypothetical protein